MMTVFLSHLPDILEVMDEHMSNGSSAHLVRVILPARVGEGCHCGRVWSTGCSRPAGPRRRAKAVRVEARGRAGAAKGGQGIAEKALRHQSGQSTRGARQELKTAGKLEDLPGTLSRLW